MATLQELETSIRSWSNLYIQKTDEKYVSRSTATTVESLEGRDPTTLLNELRVNLVVHLNDKDNPHQTTANDIGVYEKTFIEDKIDQLFISDLIPSNVLDLL